MVPSGTSNQTSASDAGERGARPMAALRILSACLALGMALWLVPATIHIVNWGSSSGGAGRVALFAPAFLLRWILGGAIVAALLLWRAGSRDAIGVAERAFIVAPLSALWVWAVPFAPWVPDKFPLLLVLAGPLRWLIAVGAAVAVLVRMAPRAGWRRPAWPVPGRRTACALSLLLYLVAGYRSLHRVGLGGDEPHYLVLTQSLLLDGDLKIENNHQRADYRQYFGGDLRPDYLQRGVNGEIYSIHAPGLPAIVLPAFAVAGAWGAVVMVCLFGALAALAVFDLAELVGGERAAWPAWAAVCLTVPFIPHAWSIFPEMPGAAIVAWALLWAARDDDDSSARAWVWAWRGACLSALPWLHTKFSVLLAVLALAVAWRLRNRLMTLVSFAIPLALSLAGWVAFFVIIYGTVDPQAPYGDYGTLFVRLANLPRSILGALFDQKFGLLAYAPVFIVSLWGTLILVRDSRWRAVALLSVGLASLYILSTGRLYMWWGGSSAPARFLVPVAPLLTPALAAAFSRLRPGILATHVWVSLALSLLVSALSLADVAPGMLFSNPHGVSHLAEMFRAASPLTTALPTFTEENWVSPLLRLALWGVAAAVATSCAWWAGRRNARRTRLSIFWPVFTEVTLFVVVASVVVGPYSADARAESVRHGRFGLLTLFDPDARRAFDYRAGALGKMSPQQWLDATALTFRLDPSEAPDSKGRLIEGLDLPQGRYQISVVFDEGIRRAGDLVGALGDGTVLSRVSGPLPHMATMQLALPIAVPELWVKMSDPPSAASARRVDVTPMAIVPVTQRVGPTVRRVESVAGRPEAYMAYVNDGAFPEGGVFWTQGTREAEVLVAPAGAPFLALTLHAGPVGGVMRLRVDGKASEVRLGPEETRVISVPVAAGAPYVSVAVQAPAGFRPSDVSATSTDTRELGCQVRVEVSDEGV